MSDIKGSNIKLGDSIRLGIQKKDQLVVTIIQGVCNAIQFWKIDEIAIRVEGIDTWIYLDDTVTVQVII